MQASRISSASARRITGSGLLASVRFLQYAKDEGHVRETIHDVESCQFALAEICSESNYMIGMSSNVLSVR